MPLLNSGSEPDEPSPKGPDELADRLGVVVVAAGSSTRMGGLDKIFAPLRGTPVLAWSLRCFEADERVVAVVVVVSEANVAAAKELAAGADLRKVAAVVKGGARRQDSVRAGLEALLSSTKGYRHVAVHDGARPFVDQDMIGRGLTAVKQSGAAVAAVRVKDTIKTVGPDLVVTATPERSTLWSVQTPQVFRADLIYVAHRRVTQEVTDDASMVELTGGKVAVFDGHPENIKITTPEDLLLAEVIAARRAGSGPVPGFAWAHSQSAGPATAGLRFGIGFDGHRLEAPGPLRLGGVDVPFEMRLAGHSDGDVLLHGVCSAVLGAAGLGDMGRQFPSSDPALKGIDSRELLRRTAAMARSIGWMPEYVDATIVAQRPKLAPYLDAMAGQIALAAGLPRDRVNVKVTSTDGVGAIGEGQGIAAQVIATVARSGGTETR
jgi:2-C-methyl-D-erythritol 4-phosphate cytidylyltransferase/2-C-methyl-D-erythritol 2,4-cyclodiphosphate synthase